MIFSVTPASCTTSVSLGATTSSARHSLRGGAGAPVSVRRHSSCCRGATRNKARGVAHGNKRHGGVSVRASGAQEWIEQNLDAGNVTDARRSGGSQWASFSSYETGARVLYQLYYLHCTSEPLWFTGTFILQQNKHKTFHTLFLVSLLRAESGKKFFVKTSARYVTKK